MSNPCDAALVPDVTLSNSSDLLRYSWLSLVNQDNYQNARNQADTSGDFELDGVFGDADSTYADFDERRNQFLAENAGDLDQDTFSSVMRQTVSGVARTAFVDCMENTAGLQTSFENDKEDVVTAVISFKEGPGISVKFGIELSGATCVNPDDGVGEKELLAGGKMEILMTRTSSSTNIYIAVSGGGYGDNAVSVAKIYLAQHILSATGASQVNGVFVDTEIPAFTAQFGDDVLINAYTMTDGVLTPVPFVGQRFAEWAFTAPEGDYSLTVRYAAGDSRPLDISVNGVDVNDSAFSAVTGGWGANNRKSFPAGRLSLLDGNNTVRITCHPGVPDFPCVNQLILSPILS